MYRQHFPAKVLLFGEHTVLRGGRALAVPHPSKGFQWTLNRRLAPDKRLVALFRFLQENRFEDYLQLEVLNKDLQKGWRLAGNVPTGYGLGSSGVVCAAIWSRYSKPSTTDLGLNKLRESLAMMESFFHGSSSGTDPLISFLNKAVLLTSSDLTVTTLPRHWAKGLFLLDTRIPRHSAPLISYFVTNFDKKESWQIEVESKWMSAAEQCIYSITSGHFSELEKAFSKLGDAQLKLVPNFIPPGLHPCWKGESYHLKLCGAGGGGYMLGLSSNWELTQQELSNWNLYPLFT